MRSKIIIKPHHLLDVLKLYGKGIEKFVPDEKFGHDFYKVANKIINKNVDVLEFTIDCDDICNPCKYKSDKTCTDNVAFLQNYSKDKFNKELDIKLLELLNIDENKEYPFYEIMNLLMKNLDYNLFKKVWNVAKDDELYFRTTYTILGVYKIIEKNTSN